MTGNSESTLQDYLYLLGERETGEIEVSGTSLTSICWTSGSSRFRDLQFTLHLSPFLSVPNIAIVGLRRFVETLLTNDCQ